MSAIDSERQTAYCEAHSFTPWHSLPEHQPIGGVNRIRKAVYERASTLRHTANGVPAGSRMASRTSRTSRRLGRSRRIF